MEALSPRVRRFLEWIRDTPHCYSGWLPMSATSPEGFTRYVVGGYGNRKVVARSTAKAAFPYIVASGERGLMWKLTPEALALLHTAGADE